MLKEAIFVLDFRRIYIGKVPDFEDQEEIKGEFHFISWYNFRGLRNELVSC